MAGAWSFLEDGIRPLSNGHGGVILEGGVADLEAEAFGEWGFKEFEDGAEGFLLEDVVDVMDFIGREKAEDAREVNDMFLFHRFDVFC
jgi:hypothetical protein